MATEDEDLQAMAAALKARRISAPPPPRAPTSHVVITKAEGEEEPEPVTPKVPLSRLPEARAAKRRAKALLLVEQKDRYQELYEQELRRGGVL